MKDAGASRIELLLYKKQLSLLSDVERAELEGLLQNDPVAVSLYTAISGTAPLTYPSKQNPYLRKSTLTFRTKVMIAVILLLLAMLPFLYLLAPAKTGPLKKKQQQDQYYRH